MPRPLLDTSPRQEQQFQERATARLARRLEAQFTREIARTMLRLGELWDDSSAQTGVLLQHSQAVERLIRREYGMAFDVFGRRIVDAAGKSYRGMETKALTFEQLRDAWIRRYAAQKVTQIVGTTHEQAERIIRDSVADSLAEGLGEAAIGRAVRGAIRERGGVLSVARGRVISRTESHTAANAATQEAARSLQIPMRKQWVASADERTREDHASANGQTVGLPEEYRVGGYALEYPGDPDGPPEQIINCRCSSIMMVD